jgi:nucleoside-diphosphate-sugar epimerase
MNLVSIPTPRPHGAPSELHEIQGRRVLVTGVNGFLGCHLAVRLQKAGADLVGIDIHGGAERARAVRASMGGREIQLLEVDPDPIQIDWHSLLEEMRPDAVFHLAGATDRKTDPPAWVRCVRANTLMTAELLDAVVQRPLDSRPVFVMPGSQMEYGVAPMPWTEDRAAQPVNPYGVSKLAATELVQGAVRNALAKACVLRLPLVYGPGQAPVMIIPELIVKALRKQPFQMTSGQQKRRFLFAPDAAALLLLLVLRLLRGEELPPILNAPASEPIAVADLARKIHEILGKPVDLQIGALPTRQNERMEAWPDTALAESLGIASLIPMQKALEATVAWYRTNDWFTEFFVLKS